MFQSNAVGNGYHNSASHFLGRHFVDRETPGSDPRACALTQTPEKMLGWYTAHVGCLLVVMLWCWAVSFLPAAATFHDETYKNDEEDTCGCTCESDENDIAKLQSAS